MQNQIQDATITEQKRERALQDVKLYMASGWEIEAETPQAFLLKRNTSSFGKHLVLFIFTWWTFGVANVIYYYASNKKKIIMK